MAEETRHQKIHALSSAATCDLKRLVWGTEIRLDIFERWSQAFAFSEDESTALIQDEGGPCAVIAPVQAFLLKNAIFGHDGDWRRPTTEQRNDLLVAAFHDILSQCATTSSDVRLVFHIDEPANHPNDDDFIEAPSISVENEGKSEESHFHSRLRMIKVDEDDLKQALRERLDFYRDVFGVIFFLYSVLLTKGLDQVKNELEDPNEPLIDGTHGHGSQSLINLLITGRAVSNVWDNDKDVSGLKLHGITKQPIVGFLTLLEHLRYCEVGWFLKCPQYPVWVLGSETHLTVLFSKEIKLCTPETPEAAARRVFKSFDPEGNNFISSVLLGDVLKVLGLFSDPGYVQVVKRKLDSEELGVILLNAFMEEFFPKEQLDILPSFTLYHYNGLKRSCSGLKVAYREGSATVVDFEVKLFSENTPVLTCLQTKWPGIQVEWSGNGAPSLN